MKDPDIVTFQGKKLIFFSAGTVVDIVRDDKIIIPHETWDIGLLSQNEQDGTYVLQPPVRLIDEYGQTLTENSEDGNRFCAPGMQVFHDVDLRTNRTNTKLAMYVHTDCFTPGNRILQFQSDDGITFKKTCVALEGEPGVGKYDPQPFMIDDQPYMSYVKYFADRPKYTDIHLAQQLRDDDGLQRWIELGPVITQPNIPLQNQANDPFYEWGIEAPVFKKLTLHNGEKDVEKFVAIFVSFQPSKDKNNVQRKTGTRQRLTIAVADKLIGEPYIPLGHLIIPQNEAGENGHGIWDGENLLFQERAIDGGWHIRTTSLTPADISHTIDQTK